MINKHGILAATAGVLIAGTASHAVYAHDGSGFRFGPKMDRETHTELQQIISEQDYDAYVEFAEANEIRVMTQEQYSEMVERHERKAQEQELVLDGDYDQWRELVGDDRMSDIDEDNFALLVDLAQAHESGDAEAIHNAHEALRESGVFHDKGHHGLGRGGDARRMHREEKETDNTN